MSEQDCEATLKEIKIMNEVDHPNIVKMIEHYEDKGHYCLVMELMQGGEVSQILYVNLFEVI
jgi:serine/threonine protein kinase